MWRARLDPRKGVFALGVVAGAAALLVRSLRPHPIGLVAATTALLAGLAAVVCGRAALRSAGAERLSWAFLSAGATLTFLAQALLLLARWQGILLTNTTPVLYALWATLYYFVFVGFYLTAFLRPHQHPALSVRPPVILDTLLLGLLLLFQHFYFSAEYRWSSGGLDRRLPGAALAVLLGAGGGVLLLCCRRRAMDARWRRIYARLSTAVVCQAASEAIALLVRGPRGAIPSQFHPWMTLADALEMLAFALLVLAAEPPTPGPRPPAPRGEPGITSIWRELSAPSLVLLGLLGIPLVGRFWSASSRLSAEAARLGNTTLLVVLGVYVLLVLVRQLLVQMENRGLTLDLRQESLRLHLLLDNIPEAVVIEDLDGRVLFSNDRFLELFGLGRSQLPGLPLNDCVHPEDRALRLERRSSEGASHLEFRGVRPDGTVFLLESTMAPVRPGGLTLGYQSVIRDITERRKAEEKQRELAQRLEFLVSQMPLACIVFDLDFRIVEWNSSASRIFGYSAEEALGRNGLDLLVAPEERPSMIALFRELSRTQAPSHRVIQSLTKTRGSIECEWWNTSLVDETGRVVAVACMTQDVTERRSLEAQLRHSQKMDAVGKLAGGVAHDFNNLLTVIQGNVSLALMRLDAGHRSVRGLRDAEKAAQRAAELVQQLLSFGRKAPGRPRPMSLNACMRET
ncbi:MAG: PAS domain S-box protein, partial [Acidobacteria bacterium]|nr:PAS domain S-box protein [Acidobacteriota bacterium]